MACFHPRLAFEIGIKANGKKDIKLVSDGTVFVTNYTTGERNYNGFKIPCGHCLGCQLERARQWAYRCTLESLYHEDNYFITLTYDDEENKQFNLEKEDLRRFINSLRKEQERKGEEGFKFFAAGEYGDKTLRPHYHLCVFGLKIDDLKYYKATKYGNLYNSERINNIWHKGHVVIANFTTKTASYVARYTIKKSKDKWDMSKYGLNKEFVLMSRRPGLGYKFFQENQEDIYKDDRVYVSIDGKSGLQPPKYYDYLLKKIDEEKLEKIRSNRKEIFKLRELQMQLASPLSEAEQNEIKERQLKKRMDLRRNAI